MKAPAAAIVPALLNAGGEDQRLSATVAWRSNDRCRAGSAMNSHSRSASAAITLLAWITVASVASVIDRSNHILVR